MIFHINVDAVSLDCSTSIFCSKYTQPFQVNFTAYWNHMGVNCNCMLFFGLGTTACNPITFTAADWAGAVGCNCNR